MGMRRRFTNNYKTFDRSKYMTIEVLEDGCEVYFNRDVEYNLNGHEWVLLKSGLISPTLKKGNLLSLRCSLATNEIFGRMFSNDKAINLRGNILSLIFKDDINLDISPYDGVFDSTFSRNNIVSVEKNFLPATILAPACYRDMFSQCANLTTAPELPATTLTSSCYASMFYGCTSLVKAPELPATALTSACYLGMFGYCTSLTTAPALPATTLVSNCYDYMFSSCNKLNYIKMLATDRSVTDCLDYWVQSVASTGTFVKNPAMSSLPTATASNYYAGIPSGWTVINDGEDSGGNSPITFYLKDTYGDLHQFNTPYSMTWGEFVASEYNTVNELGDKYFKDIGIIQYGNVIRDWTPDGWDSYTGYQEVYKNESSVGNEVYPDEYIREDITYTT